MPRHPLQNEGGTVRAARVQGQSQSVRSIRRSADSDSDSVCAASGPAAEAEALTGKSQFWEFDRPSDPEARVCSGGSVARRGDTIRRRGAGRSLPKSWDDRYTLRLTRLPSPAFLRAGGEVAGRLIS